MGPDRSKGRTVSTADEPAQGGDEIRVLAGLAPKDVTRALIRQPQVLLLCFILPGAVLMGVVPDLYHRNYGSVVAQLLALVAIAVSCQWFLRRSMGKRADGWARDAQWVITDEGVGTTTADGTSFVRWGAFHRIEDLGGVLSFRIAGGGMMLLPRDSITAGDLDQTLAWARAANVHVKGLATGSALPRSPA
jgi:hypothetical protein